MFQVCQHIDLLPLVAQLQNSQLQNSQPRTSPSEKRPAMVARRSQRRLSGGGLLLGLAMILPGCARSPATTPPASEPSTAATSKPEQADPSPSMPISPSMGAESASPAATPVETAQALPMPPTVPPHSPPEIPTISLSSTPMTLPAAPGESADVQNTRRELFEIMKPVQILLGNWHGTTQKEVGDFKGLDHSAWVWDLKTNRQQPAMVMASDANPYFRTARLTYLTDEKVFQFEGTDPDGKVRTLTGNFTVAPEQFDGEDRTPQIRYKLELTQIEPQDARDQMRIVLNQQDNHRYFMEIQKKRGSRFLRVDTVAIQREGTSFAKSDSGYGERECIISGGLGTIQLNYKGKSYWVCCTGCKAAFEEDPDTWIAEYEKKSKK